MESHESTDEENQVREARIIQREHGEIVFVSLERNPAIRYINNFIKEQKELGYQWRQIDTSVICLDIPTVYLMFQNDDNLKENLKLIEFPMSDSGQECTLCDG